MNKKIKIICIVSILLSFSTYICSALTLVDNGIAKSCIVISESAPRSVRLAAKELQSHIKEISGTELQIYHKPQPQLIPIFLGDSQWTQQFKSELDHGQHDLFIIKSSPQNVSIIGRDYTGNKEISSFFHPLRTSESFNQELELNRFGEAGTLYGVYEFLRRFLGVRWYMPGELGKVIPTNKVITIPDSLDISMAPDFEYRVLFNCSFPKDKETALWNKRVGYGAAFPVPINHSFYFLRKYRNTSPEIFAIKGGKPDFDRGCMGMGNLCLSNPLTKKLFVKHIIDYFAKNPEQWIYPVVPNDSFIEICECTECQSQIETEKGFSGKFSNYVWKFVNAVAKDVQTTFPEKFVGCLAYATFTTPPDMIEKFSSNVVVMICKKRRKYNDGEYRSKMERTIDLWSKKVAKKNIYVWEYYNWHITPFLRNIPVFYPDFIAEDLKRLTGRSKGEFIEAESWFLNETGNEKMHWPGLTHLNYYMTGRLLWNSKLNINYLLSEYCRKFYGPAGDYMLKFWKQSAELWQNKKSSDAEYLYRQVYNEHNVNQLCNILEQALSTTKSNSCYNRRIKLIIDELIPLRQRTRNSRIVSTPQYQCLKIEHAPKLDGLLNDECWLNAVPFDMVNNDGTMPKHPSRLRIVYDTRALYLAIENYDTKAESIVTKASTDSTKHPYIWEDDSIEVLINPIEGRDRYYKQFIVNAIGTLWDSEFDGKNNIEEACKWDSCFKATTAVIDSNLWQMEIEIPFSDITGNAPLYQFKMNIIRNRNCGENIIITSWSPTLTGNNHNQTRFGRVILKDNVESLAKSDKKLTSFEEIYQHFKNCRKADVYATHSYQQVANEFEKIAPGEISKENKERCLYYSALCSLLADDYIKADKLCELLLKNQENLKIVKAAKLVLSKTEQISLPIQANIQAVKRNRIILELLSRLVTQNQKLAKFQEAITSPDYKCRFKPCDFSISRAKKTVLTLASLTDKYMLSFNKIEEHVKQAVCVGALRIIGAELYLYTQTHGNKFPLIREKGSIWPVNVLKNIGEKWADRPEEWTCPQVGHKGYGYGMNVNVSLRYLGKLSDIPNKNCIVLLADSVHYSRGNYPHKPDYAGAAFQIQGTYEHLGIGTIDRKRHLGGANVLFVDGHVEWLRPEKIPQSGTSAFWMGTDRNTIK